jgi:ATP-dependent helicase HrpB
MLLDARALGLGALGCDLAAMLSERDIVRARAAGVGADLVERLAVLALWRAGGEGAARARGADPAACARVDRAARQARETLGVPASRAAAVEAEVGRLLARAYPDRIAQRQPGPDPRYRLVTGRAARLDPGDPLGARPYLVAAALDAGTGDGRVFLAVALEGEGLREVAGRAAAVERVEWDACAGAVVARAEERLGALVLGARPLDRPDPAAVLEALVDGIRRAGPGALPWTDAAREVQARVLSLRAWRPDEGWPDLGDEALMAGLEEWLAPSLAGVTRLDQLARLDLAGLLLARLDWRSRPRLEDGAPTHLQVPSGARRRLAYRPGEPPVLAVKLQELFGLAETPRVCWGEVPVTLHLLSPAGRPMQVTRDLRGFWERTYPEVRRELRGRYPKHPWPEDPWSARPTAGVKRGR